MKIDVRLIVSEEVPLKHIFNRVDYDIYEPSVGLNELPLIVMIKKDEQNKIKGDKQKVE